MASELVNHSGKLIRVPKDQFPCLNCELPFWEIDYLSFYNPDELWKAKSESVGKRKLYSGKKIPTQDEKWSRRKRDERETTVSSGDGKVMKLLCINTEHLGKYTKMSSVSLLIE